MTWRIRDDSDGLAVTSSRGTLTIPNLDHELAQTLRTLLNQYERRKALADGKVNTFVHDHSLPGKVGEEVATNRAKLLQVAHEAERIAEEWLRYGEHLDAVLTPPKLPELPIVNGVGNVDDRRERRPALARSVSPVDVLTGFYGAVQLNIKAYLDLASRCREELAAQYNEEQG